MSALRLKFEAEEAGHNALKLKVKAMELASANKLKKALRVRTLAREPLQLYARVGTSEWAVRGSRLGNPPR